MEDQAVGEEAPMMPPEGLTIYNLPPSPPNWDAVGIFYVTYCVTWTTLVFAGITFCWINRSNPILRIRNLPLSFFSIIFLHAYWILAQVVYPIGMTMPIVLAYDIQYFFMGIWFPLGVALFHASNLRFLHVAKLQKQFTHHDLRGKDGCDGAKGSWLCRLRNMNYTKRIMIFIGLGMIFQGGMWVACEKYHPTYGIPGTGIKGETLEEQIVDLGRGWEWWPSVLWQVIWTWIVAPILIWRAWGIRDTMGWRTQTVGCCISSLHATPMFLIASYVPAFQPVNMYFAPSQWIHLSIKVFVIFTVFVPAYQVLKLRILSKKAAACSAKWETASQNATLRPPSSQDGKYAFCSSVEKGQSLDFSDESMSDRLMTMGALEHALDENPKPLQEFSALCDFSGENVAFLTRASAWRESFPIMPTGQETISLYNTALKIYADFISPRDADFPLNLQSKDLRDLEDIFEKPTRVLLGEATGNVATPFDDLDPSSSSASECSTKHDIKALYTGPIPSNFNAAVLDQTIEHIKYLVLTNTWPKFVRSMQQEGRRSAESERSGHSGTSQTTLASRVSSKVSTLVRSFL